MHARTASGYSNISETTQRPHERRLEDQNGSCASLVLGGSTAQKWGQRTVLFLSGAFRLRIKNPLHLALLASYSLPNLTEILLGHSIHVKRSMTSSERVEFRFYQGISIGKLSKKRPIVSYKTCQTNPMILGGLIDFIWLLLMWCRKYLKDIDRDRSFVNLLVGWLIDAQWETNRDSSQYPCLQVIDKYQPTRARRII